MTRLLIPGAAMIAMCAAMSHAGEPFGERFGEPWRVASGTGRTALVELYTSEGCSSCPPADRWLSELRLRDDLWTGVVPVAFHVTYWDGLGWKDRFGRKAFDQRHRRVAGRAGSVVYTPGMFLNGREWRGWRVGRKLPQSGPVGTLTVTLTSAPPLARVEFAPLQDPAGIPTARLAWLLANEHTDVQRGENRGRSLRHDFVASALQRAALAHGGASWTVELDVDPDTRDSSRALAVWVVDDSGLPLQATGGWLP